MDDGASMVESLTECASANRAAGLLEGVNDIGGPQILHEMAAQQGTRP